MSAASIETEVVDVPVKGKPSRSAIKVYKQSVFDGVCDPQINFDARRIDAEWQRDRATYQARVRACESLKVEVPRLEAAAAEAVKLAGEAEAFARSALGDNVTIGELRQRIHGANPKLPVSTPAEIAAAVAWLVRLDGYVGWLKSDVVRKHGVPGDCRSRARFTLSQTGTDTGPTWTETGLSQKIAELQRRIAGRQEILAAESKLPLVRCEVEQLSRGQRPPTALLPLAGQPPTPLATLYRAARRKLDALLDLVAGKDDAVKADAADKAELAELQSKVAAARESGLQRLADPAAMKWCGDE